MTTDSLTPIANSSDHDWCRNLYLMWAGYGTKCYVWANSFDDAFETFAEWLDDNAPGCLTSFSEDDYKAAAKELGLTWPAEPGSEEECKVAEATEVDHTVIGHTTLNHGTHIASYEWGGDDVTDEAEFSEVKKRCEPKWAYGNGQPGCLYDHSDGPFDTRDDAASSAADLLELTEEEKAELIADGRLYFDSERRQEVGVATVELFEVDADWSCE